MPRPKLRDAALKDAIIVAARAILETDGVTACTTRRIAQAAGTSPPALYELFGDKAGVLRAVFFSGFRDLAGALGAPDGDDPRATLEQAVHAFRRFALEHPALSALMFSRPVHAFDPDRAERAASDGVRRRILTTVRRCIDAGQVAGDPIDVAHAILALAMGLAQQERAGWLGSAEASRTRRWTVAIRALLDGLRPTPVASPR